MKATVIYNDVEFDVEFDYQPYEKPIYYYPDGSGYPGCEQSMDICFIGHEGRDLTEYFSDCIDEFKTLVYENMEEYAEFIYTYSF